MVGLPSVFLACLDTTRERRRFAAFNQITFLNFPQTDRPSDAVAESDDRWAPALKSKVVHLCKGAVRRAVNGSVVVDQRLSFFGLRAKTMFVLPGCRDTEGHDVHVRRPVEPGEPPHPTTLPPLPSFTKNSAA